MLVDSEKFVMVAIAGKRANVVLFHRIHDSVVDVPPCEFAPRCATVVKSAVPQKAVLWVTPCSPLLKSAQRAMERNNESPNMSHRPFLDLYQIFSSSFYRMNHLHSGFT